MASPTSAALDGFNRSVDENPIKTRTIDYWRVGQPFWAGTVKIVGNTLAYAGAAAGGGGIFHKTTLPANQPIELWYLSNVLATVNDDGPLIILASSTAATASGYAAEMIKTGAGWDFILWRIDTGTWTQLASGSANGFLSNDSFLLQRTASGVSISAGQAAVWSVICSAVDTTYYGVALYPSIGFDESHGTTVGTTRCNTFGGGVVDSVASGEEVHQEFCVGMTITCDSDEIGLSPENNNLFIALNNIAPTSLNAIVRIRAHFLTSAGNLWEWIISHKNNGVQQADVLVARAFETTEDVQVRVRTSGNVPGTGGFAFDASIEVYIGGTRHLNATGIKLTSNVRDSLSIGFGPAGPVDKVWLADGLTFPTSASSPGVRVWDDFTSNSYDSTIFSDFDPTFGSGGTPGFSGGKMTRNGADIYVGIQAQIQGQQVGEPPAVVVQTPNTGPVGTQTGTAALPTLGTCCESPTPPGGAQVPTPGDTPAAVGWTPVCGPSTGTLPSVPAPTVTSMAGVRDPRHWVSFDFQEFNTDNSVITDVVEAWTMGPTINDPPGYQLARKPGIVTEVSEITTGLSDDSGILVGSSMAVTLSDKDRAVLRTRLADPEKQFIVAREGRLTVYSEAKRRIQDPIPREIFRGLCTNSDLAASFNAQLKFEDMILSQLGRYGGDVEYSRRKFPKWMLPGLPFDMPGKPVQYPFGEISDHGAIIEATGADGAKGMVPLWLMGARQYNGFTYDEYHLAGAAVVNFELYGTNNAAEKPKRVWLDLDALGAAGDVLSPGHTGWPLSDKFLDILNPADQGGDGLIHRVTHIFIKSTHYLTDAHKRGSVTLAANVCGIEDQGDGLGNLITDFFTQAQFVCEQIILPLQEWTSGLYQPAPTWNDLRPIADSESFQACQAYTAKKIGGRGYQGAFLFGGPGEGAVRLREAFKRFSDSSNCRFTWAGAGQLKCHLRDQNQIVASNRHYREPSGIREWPSPTYDDSTVENPVRADYDYDDDARRFRAQIELPDPIAMTRMGGPRASKDTVKMRCVRDSTTAKHVVAQRLFLRRYPKCMVPLTVPIDGLDHDPGDVVLLTSQEGPGTGFDAEPGEIQIKKYSSKARRTVLLCEAVGNAAIGMPKIATIPVDLTAPAAPAVVTLTVPGDPDVMRLY